MGFQGYFIKVGDYTIPLKYINAGTYKAQRSVLDSDTYTDADGVLHRDALEHVPCKAEFETIPTMSNDNFAELMKNIRKNYINALERKVRATVFIPEVNDYITQEMYMPDIVPVISEVINGELYYEPIRLAFIGY